MPYELPPLPYAMDALEPYIDARTVEIHYTKHHTTYLKNLNAALEKYPDLGNHPAEDLLKDLQSIPEDIRAIVRNNGGGFVNHNFYWASMAPNAGGEPQGDLGRVIAETFGSFAKFKEDFEKAGVGRFGSGYAWLSRNHEGKLIIHSTPNQDSPVTDKLIPLLVVDVWEHAYYLKYQNRRAEYLTNWWNLVNWAEVDKRFAASR
jgi:superoxide dismutase, Fe-Mn family